MRILGISGKKQSGKDTACRFLYGQTLISTFLEDGKTPIWSSFSMDMEGNLYGPEENEAGDRKLFDVDLVDSEEKLNYMMAWVFPHIMAFSCADALKDIASNLFGLTYEQCWGTNEDKETNTPYDYGGFAPISLREIWDCVSFYSGDLIDDFTISKSVFEAKVDKPQKATAREFLQLFGTMMRNIDPNVWARKLISNIEQSGTKFAVVRDVRYPNEVEHIKRAGGKVIRLHRQLFDDQHSSETALDKENYDWSNFDAVLETQNCEIPEKNQMLLDILKGWNWFD